MSTRIDHAKREVQRALENAVRWAEDDDPRTFHAFETELWHRLLAFGRALMGLFLARHVERQRPARYEHVGRQHVLTQEFRSGELGTRCGKLVFERPVGRQLGFFRRAKADLPIDRELGLCGGFSLGAAVAVVRLCAQMAFAPARATFREFAEWAPSPRATLRMVDAVGEHARAFFDQVTMLDDDGEILVIMVDARGAPMIGSVEYSRRRLKRAVASANRRAERRSRRRLYPPPRRTKGKKSKNAKGAFVGVIYTLRATADGLDGPVNKRLYATFESHRALFDWLKTEALKRGYGRKRTLFLADGSDHIWRLQEEFFADAEACVDWYHVVEKLWAAGGSLYPEGSAALGEWVHEQKKLLRRGKASAVIANLSAAHTAIPKTGPGVKAKRKRLLDAMLYLGKNQHRMHYDQLRRDDLPIGSGAVEGAVRNLVAMRLDGPGMRWGRDRSEAILQLRCILLNGQWNDFVDYLAQRSLTLRGRPKPARTYDATPHELREAA